jgi:cell division protein FtsZ
MDRRQFIQSVSALGIGSICSSVTASCIPNAAPNLFPPSNLSVLNCAELSAEEGGPRVGVVAIGGAASTLLNSVHSQLHFLERSIAIDVDPFSLHRSGANEKILVGEGLNKKIDFREVQEAFSAVIPDLLSVVGDLHLVFILAGLGGVTGTALAPSVATVLNQQNIFNIGFGITPFGFEGHRRQQIGVAGLHALERRSGSTFHSSNEDWAKKVGHEAKFDEALLKVPAHFLDIYHGLVKPCNAPGFVGVDFEDIRTVMSYTSPARVGIGYSNRGAREAIDQVNIDQLKLPAAQGVLVVIESSPAFLKFREINEVMNQVKASAHSDATIIFSAHETKDLSDRYKVTLMTSGRFV